CTNLFLLCSDKRVAILLFVVSKDPRPPLSTCGVYRLPCSCEHKRNCRQGEMDKSAVAEHAIMNGHQILFDDTQVIFVKRNFDFALKDLHFDPAFPRALVPVIAVVFLGVEGGRGWSALKSHLYNDTLMFVVGWLMLLLSLLDLNAIPRNYIVRLHTLLVIFKSEFRNFYHIFNKFNSISLSWYFDLEGVTFLSETSTPLLLWHPKHAFVHEDKNVPRCFLHNL
ncbi:hypothetical protein L9F63_000126, partial [Diploptera punctata]